jgi:phosphonate transport system substrate-binding protein
VDAASVADRIFDSAAGKGMVKADDFVVIWRSQPIPESPMVWRKNLDAATKQKVAAAMADIKDLPWGDQGVLNGFAPTNDQAYDVVRQTAKVLKLDLGRMK